MASEKSGADISDAARREISRNSVWILLAQLATKLGDAITSPKTVLAWIMVSVQAPIVLTGFLVPVRESGSLLPQLLIAAWVRQLAVRKWIWVAGSIVQAACVAAMGLAALTLEGLAAGLAIVGLLAVFSLARGFCSIASKDVLGKTIPKRRRGKLTGWSVSIAGLVTLCVGLAFLSPLSARWEQTHYLWLLFAAGLLWLAGAAVFARVVEFEGDTDDGGPKAVIEAIRRLALLRTDRPFRRFVVARSLLLCSALSAPYYVLLAREISGDGASLLGMFIFAGGLASLVSGPVWGRLADRSSKKVMAGAALISGLVGVCVFLAVNLFEPIAAIPVFFPVAYFALSVAHDGVRIGRKTYVVDLAGGNRRTDYVAVSNSVIGVVLLIVGMAGLLAQSLGLSGVVLLLSILGLSGAWMSLRLAEAE